MDTQFSDIQGLLDKAIGGTSTEIGVHGSFWRDVSREEFIELIIFGEQLIQVDDSQNSGLIKALTGRAPFDGSRFPSMPSGFPPMEDCDISTISAWIDNGCPDPIVGDGAA